MNSLNPPRLSASSFNQLNKLIKKHPLKSNEVIELLASHDTLTKKLTYNYLIDKSSKDSEFSLLTANLLLRDSNDANPIIRGSSLLALSSLCGMEELAISAVNKGLSDSSAQVRRTSCICCINLHRHSPSSVMNSGLVDILYERIRDSDPIVITNSLFALDKLLKFEGSLVINKNIANYLFQKLPIFSSCSLVYVLNILCRYTPKSEEELFSLLNELDFCLNSTVPSLLVASTKLFLHLIKEYPNLKSDLLESVKPTICKILATNFYEATYLLLNFLEGLKIDLKIDFESSYKVFLLKRKDPHYLKIKKLEILILVASDNNVIDIISDIQHYISDIKLLKSIFQCLGVLGSLNEESLKCVCNILGGELKNSKDVIVVASALKCFLTIALSTLGKNDDNILVINEILGHSVVKTISQATIQEECPLLVIRTLQCLAPYMDSVQDLVEDLAQQMDSWDSTIKCIFITTVTIIFLHSPSQVQPILSNLLSKNLDSHDVHLRNHTAFIYAVLEEGPLVVKKLLAVSYA